MPLAGCLSNVKQWLCHNVVGVLAQVLQGLPSHSDLVELADWYSANAEYLRAAQTYYTHALKTSGVPKATKCSSMLSGITALEQVPDDEQNFGTKAMLEGEMA